MKTCAYFSVISLRSLLKRIRRLDSRGPLRSKRIPSMIVTTNIEVMHVMNSSNLRSAELADEKRGTYNELTPEFKVKVVRYALSLSY